jgi:hypothetical protein
MHKKNRIIGPSLGFGSAREQKARIFFKNTYGCHFWKLVAAYLDFYEF